MEPIFAQETGEDGAHLLEAERDLTAFFLAGVGDHREMRRVNFEPGRLGCRNQGHTEDGGEEAYAKRNRQNSRHGRRVERTTKGDATTCVGRCCELPGNTKVQNTGGTNPACIILGD